MQSVLSNQVYQEINDSIHHRYYTIIVVIFKRVIFLKIISNVKNCRKAGVLKTFFAGHPKIVYKNLMTPRTSDDLLCYKMPCKITQDWVK